MQYHTIPQIKENMGIPGYECGSLQQFKKKTILFFFIDFNINLCKIILC